MGHHRFRFSSTVMRCLVLGAMAITATGGTVAQLPTELFLRGYSVIPSPRQVRLGTGDFGFSSSWAFETTLPATHVAIRSLLTDLRDMHGLSLRPAGSAKTDLLALEVRSGAAKSGAKPELDRQAYRITLTPHRILIEGNSDQGLFYGVQTFLQLLKPDGKGSFVLPVGTIEDWPTFELRFLHWDTKHHQDRMDTLKRYLDWSARFKVNMIGFELEDKFEYPSHPIIGAPGAYTTAELQEIVNYGIERFIQVVPQIQSPAHMSYVLKHPEFADLQADGNNYQSCLCDERTYQVIFSMYEDVMKATQGVKYFHVSTDEVYYPDMCAKCDRPHTPENRSLLWIDFANRAHDFLSERGRRMLAWVEYPVLPKHVRLLAPDLINAVMSGNPDQTREEMARGMDELIYTSMQGEELLFPDDFPMERDGKLVPGRLEQAFRDISRFAEQGRPIGVYGAAWDDSGLHCETFWLGWSAVAQAGWNPASPSVEQHVTNFMNVFYAPGPLLNMTGIYRGLQAQARFFERSWDRVPSRVRSKAYGNSRGKGIGGERKDLTLPAPPMPEPTGLEFAPLYTGRYAELAKRAVLMANLNEALIGLLNDAIPKVGRNRYNLEVFLSIANLTGHHDRMIAGFRTIEETLAQARSAADQRDPKRALELLLQARRRVAAINEDSDRVFADLKTTWEKSRFPKGQEVNGKKFYHVMDDTKDHFADRRPDLSYLMAPEESIGLQHWISQLTEVASTYAKANKQPIPEF
jgi:hexosaminidase